MFEVQEKEGGGLFLLGRMQGKALSDVPLSQCGQVLLEGADGVFVAYSARWARY